MDDLMRELGHANTQTTIGYLRFPEQRILDDFPSLREYILNHKNMPKSASMVTKSMVTQYPNVNKLSESISG